MRKSILFTGLALLTALPAMARSLSPEEALSRALPQARKVAPRAKISRSTLSAEPILTLGSVYLFSQAEGGTLIVSANDVAAPVLGYTDAPIDPENLPENLRGWLENVSAQIDQASAFDEDVYTDAPAEDFAPIAPLMETKWDQTAPFNNDTPNHWPTGCVATAMAQVMKYHNWPEQAADNAVFSYVNSGTTLSANFSNYAFAWDDMLDSYQHGYTSEQASSVAKLMQACGYSVKMKYASVASGAVNQIAGAALANYFKYDQGLHNEPREAYTTADWESMLYENLRDCGPVIYWGGIHCFVCDGYQGDGYFHFNWGWAGSGDGYFLIDALNPKTVGTGGNAAGYNSEQGALFGIKPAGTTPSPRHYTFYTTGLTATHYQGTYVYMDGLFTNYSPFVAEGTFAFMVYNEDGSELIATVPFGNGSKPSGLQTFKFSPDLRQFGISSPISTSIIGEGSYRVYPAFIVDDEPYRFECAQSAPSYVIYHRGKDGYQWVYDCQLPDVGHMEIHDLSTNGDLYVGQARIKISGIAQFTGDATTSQKFTWRLLSADSGAEVIRGDDLSIQFTPEGKPFDVVCQWLDNQLITPGEYTFALSYINEAVSTENYQNLASCPVTVLPRENNPSFETTDLTVDNPTAVDPENIAITATINGTAGYIYQDIFFEIYDAFDQLVWGPTAEPLYVTAGNTVTVATTASIPDAQPGETYYAKVFKKIYGNTPDYIYPAVPFTVANKSGSTALTQVRLSAGNATITTPDPITAITILNIQGQQINAPIHISANTAQITLPPGLYICTIRTCADTRTLKLHLK